MIAQYAIRIQSFGFRKVKVQDLPCFFFFQFCYCFFVNFMLYTPIPLLSFSPCTFPSPLLQSTNMEIILWKLQYVTVCPTVYPFVYTSLLTNNHCNALLIWSSLLASDALSEVLILDIFWNTLWLPCCMEFPMFSIYRTSPFMCFFSS